MVDDDLIQRLLDAQQDINLAANETMRQSLADASALIDEIEPILRAALRAQPQAREDAQPVAGEGLPVAWVIRTKDGHIRMWTMSEARARTAAAAWGMEAKQEGLSPITHPAPDALWDAERYRYLRSRDPGPDGALPPAGLFIGRVPDNVILTEGDADAAIDQALAALQAEQKGGA